MKKEVIIAIILGFGLGLVITFGIWKANQSLQNRPQPTPTPQALPTPETTPTPAEAGFKLKISEPEDNTLSDQEEITLAGETLPEAVIVIFSEEGEKIIEADDEGFFETEITLTAGANQILIKAFDQEGNQAEKELNLVFSTAEI